MVIDNFWNGFDKNAASKWPKEKEVFKKIRKGYRTLKKHPVLTLGALLAPGAAVASAYAGLHADTPAGKATSIAEAEASGHEAASAARIRKKYPLHYYLSPSAPGPLREGLARLNRRTSAATAEHPYKANMIPLYAQIKGGDAGMYQLKKSAGTKNSRKMPVDKKTIGGALAAAAALAIIKSYFAKHPSARDHEKAMAESKGHLQNIAAYNRKKYPGHYILNPSAAGPITELTSLKERKEHALRAESPIAAAVSEGLTGTLPLNPYALLRKSELGKDGVPQPNNLRRIHKIASLGSPL